MKMRTRLTYHGIEWWVEGDFVKGEEAKWYLRNGDPGYPGSADDLFDVLVTIRQGKNESDNMTDILDDRTCERLIDMAIEAFKEDDQSVDIPFRGGE